VIVRYDRKTAAAWTVALVTALFAAAKDGRAESEFIQPQAVFEKAIRNMSTSTYVVFATVVNEKTGEAHTECMPSNLLMGAIHKEYDLDHSVASREKAIQIALQNSHRIFHFSKQAAIDNIPTFDDSSAGKRRRDDYQNACPLVREGKSVFFTDRGWQIRVDQ
jgi:hypothetical protein